VSKPELVLLIALSLGLAAWYARPQLFYAAYSLYEFIRIVVPLPPLGVGS
jgi:hypothetical protein